MHAGFAKIDWRLSGPASCEQRTRSSEQFQVVAVCVPAPGRAVLSWCSGYTEQCWDGFPWPWLRPHRSLHPHCLLTERVKA